MRIVSIVGPAEPLLDPDLIWDGRAGDLATTGLVDPLNPGGLRNGAAIETAVLICLMTDRRVDPTELLDGDVNRGWPGDAFDMADGETPLGSKLWLLRRRALTADIEILAQDYAREALQTLVDQGVFVRVDVTAEARRDLSMLDISISGYGRDGGRSYEQRYAVLWEQV
jgi:phage gp46-like protein